MSSGKKPNRNPKHLYYMHLLRVKRWKLLKNDHLNRHPLCQVCEREGKTVSARDVHHIRPVEGVQGTELTDQVKAEMESRCYDPTNLISLCIPCHIEIHRQMHSHEGQMQRLMPKEAPKAQDSRLSAFVERTTGKQLPAVSQPKPKKGIRKTRFGWVTQDEYRQKKQEEFDAWLRVNDRKR